MAVATGDASSTTSKKRFGLFRRRKSTTKKQSSPTTPVKKKQVALIDPKTTPYNKVFPSEIAPPPTIAEKAINEEHKQKNDDDKVMMKKSFLARTSFFQNMAASAFDLVDADGSGAVDEKELYSGLLMIHLKLGTYAGPAACKVSRR
jgi:hypothetical protein